MFIDFVGLAAAPALGLLPLKRNSNITYDWLGTKPEPETVYINTNMGRLSVAQLAQSVIVETANSQLPYDELLRLCDLYPLRVEPKGDQ